MLKEKPRRILSTVLSVFFVLCACLFCGCNPDKPDTLDTPNNTDKNQTKTLSTPENIALYSDYDGENTKYTLKWDSVENAEKYTVVYNKSTYSTDTNELKLTISKFNSKQNVTVTANGNGKEYTDSKTAAATVTPRTISSAIQFELLEDKSGYSVKKLNEDLSGIDTTISLPDYYQGLPVKEISPSGFTGRPEKFDPNQKNYNDTITAVYLPKFLETIKNEAFTGLIKLSTVEFNEGLTKIESYAFSGCSSLKSLALPDSLVYIGDSIIHYTGISKITIPKNVKYIGDYAFVTSAVFSDNSVKILSENIEYFGCLAFSTGTLNIEGTTQVIPAKRIWFDQLLYKYTCETAEEIDYIKTPVFTRLIAKEAIVFNKDTKKINTIELSDGIYQLNYDIFRISKDKPEIDQIVVPVSVTSIGQEFITSTLTKNNNYNKILYKGTEEQFKQIKGYAGETSKGTFSDGTLNWGTTQIYYFSQTEPPLTPDGLAYDGNYWHYVNDRPTLWEK